MNYEVFITQTAEADLSEALDYIEFVLLNPQAAANLLDKSAEAFKALSQYAMRHGLINDPVLMARDIRFMPIDNYLAFYTIDEKTHVVSIIRFLYAKRNWIGILKSRLPLN